MADNLFNSIYNPDVLECIANLSNDEVFTPPAVANAMLDMLPQELFRSPDTKFLDPATKSGVFLREIAKRLLVGLEDQIPDLQERVDHIFQKQLYGIAITELTSHLARRSVYCSKYASGKYSISHFDTVDGNIRYKNTPHRFVDGKCVFCGASESEYGGKKREGMETHAYEFIHTTKPQEILKMKFDVIVSNPPYQLSTTENGKQAKPLYNLFIEQMKKLNPRYLTMIIPSRWYSGGLGLDSFRNTMMKDRRIRCIVDYANAKDCFPQNSISGGVCYFLWDRDYIGDCKFINISGNTRTEKERALDEFPIIVRYNEAVDIIHKACSLRETSFSTIVSGISPFGLPTNYRAHKERQPGDDIRLYINGGKNYMSSHDLPKGHEYIGKYKILLSRLGAEHAGEPSRDGTFQVLSGSLQLMDKNDACTHTYRTVGPFSTKEEARHALQYMKTKFFRFLTMQTMTSINISVDTFSFVPMQDFSKPWIDNELYKKYNLSKNEIDFIESIIKPMDLNGGDEDVE